MSADGSITATPNLLGDILVEDIEYLRHDSGPLLLRLYRPMGPGPFPVMIDLHGDAWCNGDRLNDVKICEALARAGIAVAALDFRMPPAAGYPASLADINHAVRWLRRHGERLRLATARIGAIGISSGGHQAMLAALRPADPRYAAIPMPEASGLRADIAAIVLCWPVIAPLARYRYAKAAVAKGGEFPEGLARVLPSHDKFWGDEAAMAEGCAVAAVERGEGTSLPPVLYLQGEADLMHPRVDLDRFVAAYRARGAQVELALYPGEVEGFVMRNTRTPAHAADAMARIIRFAHATLG